MDDRGGPEKRRMWEKVGKTRWSVCSVLAGELDQPENAGEGFESNLSEEFVYERRIGYWVSGRN